MPEESPATADSGSPSEKLVDNNKDETPSVSISPEFTGDLFDVLSKTTKDVESQRATWNEEASAKLKELLEKLPEGSRLATTEERDRMEAMGRRLPPRSVAAIVPEGTTVSTVVLKELASSGLVAMPPLDKAIHEIIEPGEKHEMVEYAIRREAAARGVDPESLLSRQRVMSKMTPEQLRDYIGRTENGPVAGAHVDHTAAFPEMVDWPRVQGLVIPPKGFLADRLERSATKTTEPLTPIVRLSPHDLMRNTTFAHAVELHLMGIVVTLTALIAIAWLSGGPSVWMSGRGKHWLWAALLVMILHNLWHRLKVNRAASGYEVPSEFTVATFNEQVAVIVGGTRGVGREVVLQLFRHGGFSRILVAENTKIAAMQDLTEMRRYLQADGVDVSLWAEVVKLEKMQITNMTSIRDFCDRLVRARIPISVLCFCHDEVVVKAPKDEVEGNFIRNCLGPFFMTKRLFSNLMNAGGRVIITGSSLYGAADDVTCDGVFSTYKRVGDGDFRGMIQAYANSKAMSVLYTKMISARFIAAANATRGPNGQPLPPAMAFVADPGLHQSSPVWKVLISRFRWTYPIIWAFVRPAVKTDAAAAQTYLKLIFAPRQVLANGHYYIDGQAQKTVGACDLENNTVKQELLLLWQSLNLMLSDMNGAERQPAVAAQPNGI